MGLTPAKTKFRKHQRRRIRGKATGGSSLHFGEFGLQVLEVGYLTTNQIEAARKTITHFLKRVGKLWLCVTADKIITARAAETRMGGGKGTPVGFVAPVKRGRIVFEVAGISAEEAKEAFRLASYKLPFKTRVVTKV